MQFIHFVNGEGRTCHFPMKILAVDPVFHCNISNVHRTVLHLQLRELTLSIKDRTKQRLRSCIAFVFTFIMVSSLQAADDGWTPLFNGTDTSGWTFTLRPSKDKPNDKPDPKDTWTVKDGVLICTGKPNGYIATEKEYENYQLRLKWRYPKEAKAGNSGVLLHVTGPNVVWPNCIEAQLASAKAGDIWLNADSDKKLPVLQFGSEQKDNANKDGRHFFRKKSDRPVEKDFGEWNQYEIECLGGDIQLKINGIVVNQGKEGSLRKGRIALQSEGAPVEFKEIEFKSKR
jgi:hypothetical protein